MSASAATPSGLERDVWGALSEVVDPEIPAVSVVDMGMIAEVEITQGRARVVVLPTFTGCPAISVITSDVAAAVRAVEGITDVDVVTTFDPPWTTARVSAEGRAKLKGFGIAPARDSTTVLLATIGLPEVSVCPLCGSKDTAAENAFGPTPCRAVYYCKSCRNPFEQFKTI